MIRIPLRAAEEAVGGFVADDLLLHAVPDELAAQHVGEVAQVAEVGRAVGDFDIECGPTAALDRPEPVGLVVEVEVLVGDE